MSTLRFSTISILFFAATLTISAQTTYQAGVSFGSNYSSLKSDMFTTTSGRIGLAAGCSFVLGFGEHFELNPEIMFTQKGASAKAVRYMPEERIEDYTINYHYNTFEAALLGGYQWDKNVPIRLQAGAYLGSHFQTGVNKQDDLYVGNYRDLNEATPAYKLNPAFSGLDFGPAVGISAGSGRFRLNVRYYHGLKNLYKNLDYVAAGPSIQTRSVRLTMTYFLK